MLTWTIGETTVTAIVESETALPRAMLLPESTQAELAAIDWLPDHFVTEAGDLRLAVQALVIQTPGKRIVVDTCMGNDKPRTQAGNMMSTDFLARFEAAGFARDSIDVVLCTHLHVDHVGWNTLWADGRWVPTFPKARYLIAEVEFEHWRGQTDGDDGAIFGDSVQPVFDAGLVDLVDTDHRICAEVSLVSSPGHTPGHVSVAISSRGKQALITGDFLHHASQIARPDWGAFVDFDPVRSAKTRRDMLADVADRPVLVIGTHFPAPTAGHVLRDGAAFRFV